MGLLRLLFGNLISPPNKSDAGRSVSGVHSGKTRLSRPQPRPVPHPKISKANSKTHAVVQPIRRYASDSEPSPLGRQASGQHALPDPSAPQNVTLPYCRYPKREERAKRAKLVYHHACTPGPTVLKGKCYVIDGDTISINNVAIRLAGIDAPELDHPYGQSAKWAMVGITKGQIITARIAPEMSYDRTVAICCLPDGRDIAAELVKQGLALDWPLFSKGRYKEFEPEGVRGRLWMTNKRQPPPVHR